MTDKSAEGEGEPPKKIVYRRLPREVEAVIGEERAEIEDAATITSDGKQFLVRFPKAISDAMELRSGYKVKFTVLKPKPRTEEEPELTMELLKDAI